MARSAAAWLVVDHLEFRLRSCHFISLSQRRYLLSFLNFFLLGTKNIGLLKLVIKGHQSVNAN
jgi:hypothetical protein